MFRCRYFHMMRNGLIDMFACCFLMELWGRMRYAPTLTDEKGHFLCPSSVGDEVAWRGRASFIYRYCMERHTGA